jgi:hypothetical protein
MAKTYDPQCEVLARHFLPDTASTLAVRELSLYIQEAIEDWQGDDAMHAPAPDPNADLKIAPTMTADCRYGDHLCCDGEESALWPDGTFSLRRCTCSCHQSISQTPRKAGPGAVR